MASCQSVPYSATNLSAFKPSFQRQSAAKNTSFTLLQANIGNVDPLCSLHARSKLCHQDVENRIAQRIKQLKPDIVSLQEVLPVWLCQHVKMNAKLIHSKA